MDMDTNSFFVFGYHKLTSFQRIDTFKLFYLDKGVEPWKNDSWETAELPPGSPIQSHHLGIDYHNLRPRPKSTTLLKSSFCQVARRLPFLIIPIELGSLPYSNKTWNSHKYWFSLFQIISPYGLSFPFLQIVFLLQSLNLWILCSIFLFPEKHQTISIPIFSYISSCFGAVVTASRVQSHGYMFVWRSLDRRQ